MMDSEIGLNADQRVKYMFLLILASSMMGSANPPKYPRHAEIQCFNIGEIVQTDCKVDKSTLCLVQFLERMPARTGYVEASKLTNNKIQCPNLIPVF
jgi:hypothetical protein